MNDIYMVGLNDEKLNQAKSKEEFKQIVMGYMSKSYPHYVVTKVIKHPRLGSWWAVCERK